MAIYVWKCNDCGEKVEVSRAMAEYERAPDEGCEKCASKEMTRVIDGWKSSQTVLVRGGRAPWFQETVTAGGKPNGR